MLVNVMWRRNVPVKYFGDNTACERVVSTGSLQLAYMKRSQGVNLAAARSLVAPNSVWSQLPRDFHEVFVGPNFPSVQSDVGFFLDEGIKNGLSKMFSFFLMSSKSFHIIFDHFQFAR